ncbi:uncharacterized protein LOC119769861 [Culex quinquefasciatus]|uniref:uncharacterized protein LOC119769861 n=1 Tax=Culex quinquefasciatus TaxID=7176 RepID=UPI0018E2B5B3|nr:uncharacterized protein LOC119769861 [Culex quinquefasciatus]
MVCSFAPEDGIFTRDGLADSQLPLLDNTSLEPIKTATFGKPRKFCHQLAYRNRNRRIGSKGNSQIVGPGARTRSERSRRNYSPKHIAVVPYPMSSTNGTGLSGRIDCDVGRYIESHRFHGPRLFDDTA